MRQVSIVTLLVLAFPILAYSQQSKSMRTEPQRISADHPASVRDILINQPDYIATEASLRRLWDTVSA